MIMFGAFGLARISNISLDEAKEAIECFLAPDPESRTRDKDGRRLEPIEGGYRVINFEKYRTKCSDNQYKAQTAKRVARWREKQKLQKELQDIKNETKSNGPLRNSNATVTTSRGRGRGRGKTHTENVSENPSPDKDPSPEKTEHLTQTGSVEANYPPTEAECLEIGSRHDVGLPGDLCKAFWEYYEGNNKWYNEMGRPMNIPVKMRRWKMENSKIGGKNGKHGHIKSFSEAGGNSEINQKRTDDYSGIDSGG